MFYSKPLKDESGTYVVKAYTDEKKKCFVQVSGNITHEDGEVSFILNDTAICSQPRREYATRRTGPDDNVIINL